MHELEQGWKLLSVQRAPEDKLWAIVANEQRRTKLILVFIDKEKQGEEARCWGMLLGDHKCLRGVLHWLNGGNFASKVAQIREIGVKVQAGFNQQTVCPDRG